MPMTLPTPKPNGLLGSAFVAMRRRQTPTDVAPGTGRHRGRPATERLTALSAPGVGAHRRPHDTTIRDTTTVQN